MSSIHKLADRYQIISVEVKGDQKQAIFCLQCSGCSISCTEPPEDQLLSRLYMEIYHIYFRKSQSEGYDELTSRCSDWDVSTHLCTSISCPSFD